MSSLLQTFIRSTIITEAMTQSKRLQAFSNSLTRQVMKILRKAVSADGLLIDPEDTDLELDTPSDEVYYMFAGDLPLAVEYDEEGEEDKSVWLTLEVVRDASELRVRGFDKNPVSSSELGIHVVVELPADPSGSVLKELRDEIAETIRHEIEHVTQGEASYQPVKAAGRDEEYFRTSTAPSKEMSVTAKYLLKPIEVTAHVRGLIHNTKTRSRFVRALEKFLTIYVEKELINEQEKKIIFETYLEWADRHVKTKAWTQ